MPYNSNDIIDVNYPIINFEKIITGYTGKPFEFRAADPSIDFTDAADGV
jgi:hypothetical protein